MLNYSIIIPHKNCPDLLQRCVNSIPKRDDVQIIVVDDNSAEGRKPSLEERKNLQVIMLDSEHSKGAGRARNIGLNHAKGKWLLFADADDYYADYLPELLDKYAEDDVTDIVYLNAKVFDENGKTYLYKSEQLILNYLKSVPDSEYKLRYSMWTPWSRMVKRKVLLDNHLQFDELPAGNDKMFCLYCSRYSKKMAVEKKHIYWYYKPSKGSQTDKNRNYLMIDGLLDVRRRTITLYKEVGYRPIPTIFELLFYSKYSKGLTLQDRINKYLFNIKQTDVSILTDIFRYMSRQINHLLK